MPQESLEATILASSGAPRTIERLSLPPIASETERYSLLGKLGEGGMGEVHLGVDRRLGREVAYKVTKRSGHASRFVREALLSARLEHPSIVPVYDVGTREDGTTYFTMRRIRGQTLETVIAGLRAGTSPYTRHRLLGAFVQLCLAIDYAHARGVVHRDLKPANVIFGDFGEVYVLDWGIAKIAGDAEEGEAIAPRDASREGTNEGEVMGTLGYMAPEQFRGEHATLDGRADVYSLGAILFEILALDHLHRGETFAEILASMQSGRAGHPAERDAEVPPELDAICAKATDPDRDARYPSARALADAIERYLEGDRDAALRTRTAQAHADRAAAALGGEADARVEAGREAARALAFDPKNELARRVLLDVVASPPAQPPEGAAAEAAAMQHESRATFNLWFSRGLAFVCVFFAIVLSVSGIRDWLTFAIMLATGFSSVLVFYAASRARARVPALETAGFVLIGATNVMLARWLGPWIVVPSAMFVNTVSMTFFSSRRDRMLRLAIAIAVVILPVLLEELRVIAPSHALGADQLVVYGHLAHLPAFMPWLLTSVTVTTLAISVVWLGLLMDRLAGLELRLHTQAWMLRRVVS